MPRDARGATPGEAPRSPRALARADAARRRRAARVGAQRPGDHRRRAVVADEHPPHRAHARSRHGHRQRARVRAAADRRDPAPAGARRRGARRACCRCCGCAAARSAARSPASLAVLVFVAVAAAGLPINTRYAFLARGDPVRVLRRRRVRLDAPAARRSAPALVDGRRRARAARARRVRAVAVPQRASRTGQTGAPADHPKRPARAGRRPLDHAALRAGRACPTTRPCRCSRCT